MVYMKKAPQVKSHLHRNVLLFKYLNISTECNLTKVFNFFLGTSVHLFLILLSFSSHFLLLYTHVLSTHLRIYSILSYSILIQFTQCLLFPLPAQSLPYLFRLFEPRPILFSTADVDIDDC